MTQYDMVTDACNGYKVAESASAGRCAVWSFMAYWISSDYFVGVTGE